MYDNFYLCILYKYVFLQYIFQGCDGDYILVFTFLMNIHIEDFFFFFTLNQVKKIKIKGNILTTHCTLHLLVLCIYSCSISESEVLAVFNAADQKRA